jgi:hypothetical protein
LVLAQTAERVSSGRYWSHVRQLDRASATRVVSLATVLRSRVKKSWKVEPFTCYLTELRPTPSVRTPACAGPSLSLSARLVSRYRRPRDADQGGGDCCEPLQAPHGRPWRGRVVTAWLPCIDLQDLAGPGTSDGPGLCPAPRSPRLCTSSAMPRHPAAPSTARPLKDGFAAAFESGWISIAQYPRGPRGNRQNCTRWLICSLQAQLGLAVTGL